MNITKNQAIAITYMALCLLSGAGIMVILTDPETPFMIFFIMVMITWFMMTASITHDWIVSLTEEKGKGPDPRPAIPQRDIKVHRFSSSTQLTPDMPYGHRDVKHVINENLAEDLVEKLNEQGFIHYYSIEDGNRPQVIHAEIYVAHPKGVRKIEN